MAFKFYQEFCTGCGLCVAVGRATFSYDKKGYAIPNLNCEDLTLCQKVCPAAGNALKNYQDGSIWGRYLFSTLGWSANENYRQSSSSGGVLTTICIYLLEKGLVDGIIQTRRSSQDIRKTETVVSKNREEVLSCMGSRYTISSPLIGLNDILKTGKTFAFVGKPCDVSALRIYLDEFRPELKKKVRYMLSFFCAGQPSIQANNTLISALGGIDLSECKSLQYRGNGWPGFAILTKEDGSIEKMDYETSWMKILGRDVRKICRFCADGTGELADISCGDAWYLGANGKPDFAERPGRNVIFIRTEVGAELFKDLIDCHCLITEQFDPESGELRKMQPYHYTRKASLQVYMWALRLCGRRFPKYDINKLSRFANGFPTKQKILRFGGTIQRILKGTI